MMNPFGLFYTPEFILLLICAALYYKAAELDKAPRTLWTGLSILIYMVTWQVLYWGWLGCLAGQIALLAGITLARVLRQQA